MCRHKGEKETFVRLVLQESVGLLLDAMQDMPGRGAYCCKTRKCFGAKNLGARVVFALEKGSASAKKAKVARQEKDCQKAGEKAVSRSPAAERFCGENAVGLLLVEQTLRQFEQNPQHQGCGVLVRDLSKLRELLLQTKPEAKVPKKRTSSIRL